MDQLLFNKYASSIIVGGCTYTPSLSNATGQMASMTRIANTPPADIDNYHFSPVATSASTGSYPNPVQHLFSDNPTWSLHDTAFRMVRDTNATYPSESVFAAAGYPVGDPNDPHYQPGRINTFWRVTAFQADTHIVPNTSLTNFPQPSYTWNDLTTNYPSATTLQNFNWAQLTGSISTGTTSCDPGSFIMFSKDNKVNQADTLGYYALVEFRNNDFSNDSELFNAGITYFNSSK